MPNDDLLERYIEAAELLMGISVDPDWQPSVLVNLKAVAAAAELVMSFPLPDEAEPAPVFAA